MCTGGESAPYMRLWRRGWRGLYPGATSRMHCRGFQEQHAVPHPTIHHGRKIPLHWAPYDSTTPRSFRVTLEGTLSSAQHPLEGETDPVDDASRSARWTGVKTQAVRIYRLLISTLGKRTTGDFHANAVETFVRRHIFHT